MQELEELKRKNDRIQTKKKLPKKMSLLDQVLQARAEINMMKEKKEEAIQKVSKYYDFKKEDEEDDEEELMVAKQASMPSSSSATTPTMTNAVVNSSDTNTSLERHKTLKERQMKDRSNRENREKARARVITSKSFKHSVKSFLMN